MPDEPRDTRAEAKAALARSRTSLQQVLAQGEEVSRVTEGLREFRRGDALAAALEASMMRRGR